MRKSFAPDREVFRSLNLTIRAGEFLSVLGPSGCGKSTLLKLVAGLDRVDSGEIQRLGSFKVGYVFQDPHLLPWRTLYENVALPLELSNVPSSSHRSLVESSLAQVGLAQSASLYPGQLSGGMKMRASLARALVLAPSLLLLDEPFAALDELTRVHLEEELRRLWQERNMTIVLVTHSFSEAVFLADRIVMLANTLPGGADEMQIPLGTQRTQNLRRSGEFSSLVQSCREKFETLYGGAFQ